MHPASAPVLLKSVRIGLGVLLSVLVAFLAAKPEWRLAAGQWWNAGKGKLETVVHGGWWWGALAAAGLTALLFLTAKLWARHWPSVLPNDASAAPPARIPRWIPAAMVLLMIAGAAVRVPRLGLSLYNDECHVFRAQLAGEVPKAHAGNPDKFRPLSWLSTLYENRAGNNSMPFSTLSRTSYDTWRALTDAPPGRVNETALRLPVLICGVLSIGAMAWLGLRLGGPRVALLAAVLTAFHPWHLRYSTEARGYGVLMLLLPLMFVALEAALRSGKWRHWLTFGVVQYLAIACWFGIAHFLVALHLTMAAIALAPWFQERRAASVRWPLLVPAVVSGVLAVGLYLLINLPHFIQLSKALAHPGFFKSPHPFPAVWFQDVSGFLGFGIPGLPVDAGNHAQPTVAEAMRTWWHVAFIAGAGVWLAGLAAGARRIFRQGGTARILAGAATGGAILTWAYCVAKGVLFLKWYSLFLLPELLILLALGLGLLAKSRPALLIPLLLLPLLVSWVPGLAYYQNHGRENPRGAVELARGSGYPDSLANPSNSLYGVTWSESPVYDPSAITLKDATALEALIARARQENRPLFIVYGHQQMALTHSAGVLAILHDPTRFRLAATLPGLDESESTHFLYQLFPKAAPSTPASPSAPASP